MRIQKSIISVVAAAAIITSFTGCGDTSTTVGTPDKNSTQPTTNDSNRISNAKGSVTGTVMDTNGNPIPNVSVSLAGKTTKTDLAGIYLFNDVAVMNTSTNNTNNNNTNNQALSVTISAPKGYLGATVTVSPQAQQISSEDTGANTTGQTNPNTNFIDGYIASAGVAVLPKLGAKVTGRLENNITGEPIVNQEISLDFRGLDNTRITNIAQAQNGVATTYATNTGYAVMTDANGIFTFVHLPMDVNLIYVVPNYNVAITNLNTNQETSLQNIGDLGVAPIVQGDSISPYVVGVTGVINPTAQTAMLEDDVRKKFVINFSEAMNMESDSDYTDSVIVKVGKTVASMTDINATATIGTDEKSIIVELQNELKNDEFLDINLLITDFKDKAGNFLVGDNNNNTTITTIGYDNSPKSVQVVTLNLRIFNDFNTNAPQVTTITQMTTDESDVNDAELLQSSSIAFNDVNDSGAPNNNIITQLNAIDSNTTLQALGQATLPNMTVRNDMARISFVPSGATSYNLKLVNSNGNVQDINNSLVIIQNRSDIGNRTNNQNGTITLSLNDIASTDAVEMTISGVSQNQIFSITPMDELGYVGAVNTITLKDNVVPTTVLQPSYGLGGTNASARVLSFGDGGELSSGGTEAQSGTPLLAITAGLLDNLDAQGTKVTGSTVISDGMLTQELYSKSGDSQVIAMNMYDTIAYGKMLKNRTIGIAFSENISLSKKPETTITTLSAWKANNDVTINDKNVTKNVDLVNFDAANVIELANAEHGKIIDFTDVISDATGNIATAKANAKVVIDDKMPPFVTKASFNGEHLSITFNENIKALTTTSSLTIENNASNQFTANYTEATKAKYTLSGKELKIKVSAFANLNRGAFNIGTKYVESTYDNEKRSHAKLSWDSIQDTRGNSWAGQNASVDAPSFAVIDMIGTFNQLLVNTDKFKTSEDTNNLQQTVIWNFNHPIKVDDSNSSNLFGTLSTAGQSMRFLPKGGAEEALISPKFTISLDKKAITLTFKTTTNTSSAQDTIKIDNNSSLYIISQVDSEQVKTVLTANPN